MLETNEDILSSRQSEHKIERPCDDAMIELDDATAIELNDPELIELKRVWRRDIRPAFEPAIDGDPLLGNDDVLVRYLNAERGMGKAMSKGSQGLDAQLVARTAQRLASTAAFRVEYACVDFHTKGMARRLLSALTRGLARPSTAPHS